MNEIIEQYRKEFVKNNFIEKVYISNEEFKALESKEDISYDTNKSSYYKSIPMEISDNELNTYISLKMLEFTDSMEKNQCRHTEMEEIYEKISTMQGIMIFWLILTIISLIGSIYTAVKIAQIIGR